MNKDESLGAGDTTASQARPLPALPQVGGCMWIALGFGFCNCMFVKCKHSMAHGSCLDCSTFPKDLYAFQGSHMRCVSQYP